jgi:glutamate racemase
MTIGVFDSGIGGEAVAESLGRAFPQTDIMTVNDHEHVPYGSRSETEITSLTDAAIQPLLGRDVIVIACNTATAVAIDWLRERYPNQLFVGLEPMVKPAVHMTQTGVVTICATPATLGSARYARLKQTYGEGVSFHEPYCSTWSRMIEDNAMNTAAIDEMVDAARAHKSDVIVLACTHYHWIKQDIMSRSADFATVIDPSDAVARHIRELVSS